MSGVHPIFDDFLRTLGQPLSPADTSADEVLEALNAKRIFILESALRECAALAEGGARLETIANHARAALAAAVQS